MTKNNLSEPQRNRTGTGNFVNLIMTSTVLQGSQAYIRAIQKASLVTQEEMEQISEGLTQASNHGNLW